VGCREKSEDSMLNAERKNDMQIDNNKRPQDLKPRTTVYGVRILNLYDALPNTKKAQTLGLQVLRSGTSVGAHYREASRWKSDRDFISKMETALQELDETDYWFDLLVGAGVIAEDRLASLRQETHELIAIFVTLVKKRKDKIKAERNKKKTQSQSDQDDSGDTDAADEDA
jgi:four helix bundle protein